jgi:hypothetical protein
MITNVGGRSNPGRIKFSGKHIKLCNWRVERGPQWEGFSYLAGAGETK